MPINIVITLVVLSFIFKRYTKKLQLLAFVLLLLFSNGYLARTIFRAWEIDPRPLAVIENSEVKTAVVLAGVLDMMPELDDCFYFKKGADRVMIPVLLYKKGLIEKILVTGGYPTLLNGVEKSEAELMRDIMVISGVDSEDIVLENESRNTRENAAFSADLLKRLFPEEEKFLLVTSAFHMRRSIGCFKKAGVDVEPFPVDIYGTHGTVNPLDEIMPSESALKCNAVFMRETLGYLIYSLVGYI